MDVDLDVAVALAPALTLAAEGSRRAGSRMPARDTSVLLSSMVMLVRCGIVSESGSSTDFRAVLVYIHLAHLF